MNARDGGHCLRVTHINSGNHIPIRVCTIHCLEVFIEVFVVLTLLPHPETNSIEQLKCLRIHFQSEMVLIDHDVKFEVRRCNGRRTVNISVFVDSLAEQGVFHSTQLRQAYVLREVVKEVVNDDSRNLRATFGEFREAMCSLNHSWLFFKRLPNIGILWLIDAAKFGWR